VAQSPGSRKRDRHYSKPRRRDGKEKSRPRGRPPAPVLGLRDPPKRCRRLVPSHVPGARTDALGRPAPRLRGGRPPAPLRPAPGTRTQAGAAAFRTLDGGRAPPARDRPRCPTRRPSNSSSSTPTGLRSRRGTTLCKGGHKSLCLKILTALIRSLAHTQVRTRSRPRTQAGNGPN